MSRGPGAIQRWLLAELGARGREPWPPTVGIATDLYPKWLAASGKTDTRAALQALRHAVMRLEQDGALERDWCRSPGTFSSVSGVRLPRTVDEQARWDAEDAKRPRMTPEQRQELIDALRGWRG